MARALCSSNQILSMICHALPIRSGDRQSTEWDPGHMRSVRATTASPETSTNVTR